MEVKNGSLPIVAFQIWLISTSINNGRKSNSLIGFPKYPYKLPLTILIPSAAGFHAKEPKRLRAEFHRSPMASSDIQTLRKMGGFPEMVGTPNLHPKMIIFSRKMIMDVGGTHHFRKTLHFS